MGIDELRIAVEILSFIAFIGVMVWATSKRNKTAFDEAAHLPFMEANEGTRP
jgi:cytochrome c oxidase cbb3-type subunit 4